MIAVYARQSVDKKDSISIESQIDFCLRESAGEEYKVYTDKGFSGGNTNRPAFEQMLSDICSGLISKVIVYKLDRISRSILDFAKIIELFRKNNVDFLSSTEKFDTSTPIGNAMLNITMVFAQLERETIQKRLKDNYYARGKKGFYLGGTTPYGLKKIPVIVEGIRTYTYEENPQQMPYILKMYDLYAEPDVSLGKISSDFNELCIPAPRGGPWDSNKISRILRNPVYVRADADIYLYYKNKGCILNNDVTEFNGEYGCFLYGRREANERKYTDVTGHTLSLGLHRGLVNSRIWLECQQKLDENRQIKNSGKGKYSWLSGLIKCGYCGYAMSAVVSGKYKYFSCRGKTNLKVCGGHSESVYVKTLEETTEYFLIEKARQLLKNTPFHETAPEDKRTNDIKLKIIGIENQITNLVNTLTESNTASIKYINEKIEELDNDKMQLTDELKKLNKRTGIIKTAQAAEYLDGWNELSIDTRKKISGIFINRISVKDGEIIIEWKV